MKFHDAHIWQKEHHYPCITLCNMPPDATKWTGEMNMHEYTLRIDNGYALRRQKIARRCKQQAEQKADRSCGITWPCLPLFSVILQARRGEKCVQVRVGWLFACACLFMWICLCMCVFLSLFVYVCVHLFNCICVCLCVFLCICVYICVYCRAPFPNTKKKCQQRG